MIHDIIHDLSKNIACIHEKNIHPRYQSLSAKLIV
jgi:hypothetical protein